MSELTLIFAVVVVASWFGYLMRLDHEQAMDILDRHGEWLREYIDQIEVSDNEPDEADWWKNTETEEADE